MSDYNLGSPHSTRLGEAMRKSKLVKSNSAGLSLKPGSRNIVRELLGDSIGGVQPHIDQAAGYLTSELWLGTRGYIEAVCSELNGAFAHGYYNAASVLLRRVIETLIIEVYESLGRMAEITGPDGHPFMLQRLIDCSIGNSNSAGLALGRNAKKTLQSVKELGDQSAHNRRFLAKVSDLEPLRIGVRITVQELIHLAGLDRAAGKS
ncbi:MAG: hypothetical protein AAF842_07180 [Planctomycetota bacterium]